jgi:hypothetical protein
MRAICGSVIAAGAMIGLGLATVGFGLRFQGMPRNEHDIFYGATTMTACVWILMVGALIGIAIAFIGLAYHHERRHRERHHYDMTGSVPGRIP